MPLTDAEALRAVAEAATDLAAAIANLLDQTRPTPGPFLTMPGMVVERLDPITTP